jgi:hypothetical protein
VGTSGRRCPNPLCGHEIPINLGQVVGDPLIDAGQEIGRATSKFAGDTKAAVGNVVGTIGGGVAQDASAGAAVGAVALFTAFSVGGFWMGMSVLVGAYICLIGTPSLLAFFISAKLLLALVSVFMLVVAALTGVTVTFKIGVALRQREKSCLWMFLPLAGIATWMTLRIPDAFSAWWDSTPWW